ncbi:MAG TPA: PDZ domain-containing protein [Kofleriaceae bacterium]|nr:PDZ domain-containing protein [Kofleriaceae bacterium]
MTRMWIAAALLSTLVGAAPARAEGPAAPASPVPAIPRAARHLAKIPYRVEKLMPDSDQAIVFDRNSGEHTLVQIGDDLGDFQVIDVDDESLTLWRDGREVVLVLDPTAALPPAILAHRPPKAVSADGVADADGVAEAHAAPATGAPLMDPYGGTQTSAPDALMDPYAQAAVAPPPASGNVVAAPSPAITVVAAPAAAVSAAAAPIPADATVVPAPAPAAAVSATAASIPAGATVVPAPAPAAAVSATAAPIPADATVAPAPTPAPAAVVSATAASIPAGATVVPAPAAAAPGDPHAVLAPPDQRASLQAEAVLDPYAQPKVVVAPAGAEPVKGVPAPGADAADSGAIRAAVMPLQRAQLQAQLASFEKLAKDYGFERTPRGVKLVRVAPDSFAYGLGLRSGDVVSAIDGAPLRGLDDAASAYVQLDSASQLRLDVERGTARGTLRFALQ